MENIQKGNTELEDSMNTAIKLCEELAESTNTVDCLKTIVNLCDSCGYEGVELLNLKKKVLEGSLLELETTLIETVKEFKKALENIEEELSSIDV